MNDETDLTSRVLHEDGDHSFIWLGADARSGKGAVQTLQYLILDKGRGWLLDPGGVHLFARVVAAVSRHVPMDRIDGIFFSHQDPDVSSGIALWLGVTPARIYISGLWTRFLPHFGIVDPGRIQPIEEAGKGVRLGSGAELSFVPTHYMHSPGAFSLYDTRAKILFSGDVGGGFFPEGGETAFVDDFPAHLPVIQGFHERLIASNSVARRWCDLVSRLKPEMIAPQHGAIYRGASVQAFLAWLSALKCGTDLLDRFYGA